ncbi:MAG: hypothetical protein ABSB95_03860 [Dissulfurispiraceae bacterium]|jgi:hypothetical protein
MKFRSSILTGLAASALSVIAFGVHRTWPDTNKQMAPSGNEQMTISTNYISVSGLYDYCRCPGECGRALACEGQTILVSGNVDYDNVFEHSRYPRLPYEKFFLRDAKGKSVEVWVVSSDNGAVFKKIFDAQKQGAQELFVKGTIRGVDMPAAQACRRGIRLELNNAKDIYFK